MAGPPAGGREAEPVAGVAVHRSRTNKTPGKGKPSGQAAIPVDPRSLSRG
jgi:hypothetical protein